MKKIHVGGLAKALKQSNFKLKKKTGEFVLLTSRFNPKMKFHYRRFFFYLFSSTFKKEIDKMSRG